MMAQMYTCALPEGEISDQWTDLFGKQVKKGGEGINTKT
jgi:hypothetical protein